MIYPRRSTLSSRSSGGLIELNLGERIPIEEVERELPSLIRH
jgi:hypothetical protein